MGKGSRPGWVAPPNWPLAPEGWSPPQGWRPDPAWPPPPPDHQFWAQAPRNRWLVVGVVLACTVALVPIGVLTAILVAAAGFDVPVDFPPGDVYALTVINDTRTPVEAFRCDDARCLRGVENQLIGASGQDTKAFNEDEYAPDPVGVSDPATHRLLGCLTPPSNPSFSRRLATTSVAVSTLHPCGGASERTHPVVRFYDPNSH